MPAAVLPGLMALNLARLGAASAVFATPARRAFHLEAARRPASDDLLRLFRLAESPGVG